MDVKVLDKRVYVTLSRRNAEDLINALQSADRAELVRNCEGGFFLSVRVEEDDDHYKDRTPGPGIHHHKFVSKKVH